MASVDDLDKWEQEVAALRQANADYTHTSTSSSSTYTSHESTAIYSTKASLQRVTSHIAAALPATSTASSSPLLSPMSLPSSPQHVSNKSKRKQAIANLSPQDKTPTNHNSTSSNTEKKDNANDAATTTANAHTPAQELLNAECIELVKKNIESRSPADCQKLYQWLTTYFQSPALKLLKNVKKVGECVRYVTMKNQQLVFREGTDSDSFYIILHGTVSVWIYVKTHLLHHPDQHTQEMYNLNVADSDEDNMGDGSGGGIYGVASGVDEDVILDSDLHSSKDIKRVLKGFDTLPTITTTNRDNNAKTTTQVQSDVIPTTSQPGIVTKKQIHQHQQQQQLKLEKEANNNNNSPSLPNNNKPKLTQSHSLTNNQPKYRRPPLPSALSATHAYQLITTLSAHTAQCTFGELGLIHNEVRSATVKCECDCEFLKVNKQDFDYIMTSYKQEMNYKLGALRKCSCFTDLPLRALEKLCLYFDLKQMSAHTSLFTQGDKCEYVYFIVSGECQLIQTIEDVHAKTSSSLRQVQVVLANLGADQVIGESPVFLRRLKGLYDMTCKCTMQTQVLAITKVNFLHHISPVILSRFSARLKDKLM